MMRYEPGDLVDVWDAGVWTPATIISERFNNGYGGMYSVAFENGTGEIGGATVRNLRPRAVKR